MLRLSSAYGALLTPPERSVNATATRPRSSVKASTMPSSPTVGVSWRPGLTRRDRPLVGAAGRGPSAGAGGGRPPPLGHPAVEAGGDDRHPDLVPERVFDDRAEDDVRLG